MIIQSGIAEGQVLQRLGNRGATVRITGSTSETGPIFATVSNAKGPLKGWKLKNVGSAAKGAFTASLANIPAGGPYRVELGPKGGKAARVKNFYVGDVWILAGQSNMQGYGDRDAGKNDAKPHPMVRALSMRREWRQAADPLHVVEESPDLFHNKGKQLSPEEAERHRKATATGVGVGVFFGREMVERSGVPQGLICTAHGGTSMEEWSPELKKNGGASLYGSMLASVAATGQPVAGMLWYQGESETHQNRSPLYTQRMKKLVAASRRDLKQPDLPWIIVQLARVLGHRTASDTLEWKSVQEQQRLLPGLIKNFETVAAIDLPLDDAIHIGAAGFPKLATRLALAADRLVLKNRRQAPAPQLASISKPRVKGGKMIVDIRYDHVVGGLRAADLPTGFSLSDAEGNVLPQLFKTTLHGDTVRLFFIGNANGCRISYGPGLAPHCNIEDGRGHALPVFGPHLINKKLAYLPYVTEWKVARAIPALQPFKRLPAPDLSPLETEIRSYNDFVNEHERWSETKNGYGFFSARLCLTEPMKLRFLMGYDGPFRLWLDHKPYFQDLAGTNPAIPDKGARTVSLAAGEHDIRVAMDLNEGRAWGFYLRFARLDVSLGQIESNDFVKPNYSV